MIDVVKKLWGFCHTLRHDGIDYGDYIELGTAAEALGQMGRMDMLGTFFKNDENSLHPIWWGARWRFKAHAETPFWRWVCSWARALRKPSDLN